MLSMLWMSDYTWYELAAVVIYPYYIYNSQSFKMVSKNHELFELFSRIKIHQELTPRASISVSVFTCASAKKVFAPGG